jgi:hypothetical protein
MARILKPFGIISETVHPVGRPHAKGYQRAWLEDAWAAYLPGQNASPQPNPDFKACKRASADGMGTTRDFQSVQEASPHGLKNVNLSFSHAGLHACTVGKAKNGREEDSATNGGGSRVPSDYDAVLEERAAQGYPDLPASLRRVAPNVGNGSPPLCDHCGTVGKLHPWDWPGRPGGITLHSSCEGAWFDSEGRRQ